MGLFGNKKEKPPEVVLKCPYCDGRVDDKSELPILIANQKSEHYECVLTVGCPHCKKIIVGTVVQ